MKSNEMPSGPVYALGRWEWVRGVKNYVMPLKMYLLEKNPDARDTVISEFLHHYAESIEAGIAHEFEILFMILANGRAEHKVHILSNSYESVVNGLAFESSYYTQFLSSNQQGVKPLNEIIGNDPKKMGIFTHHVNLLQMEKYPDIIVKHSDVLIHQMQARIDSLWDRLNGSE